MKNLKNIMLAFSTFYEHISQLFVSVVKNSNVTSNELHHSLNAFSQNLYLTPYSIKIIVKVCRLTLYAKQDE